MADDLEAYNGETDHDMWGDYDNYENTGNPDVFVDDSIDTFIDNLNDWD